MGPQHEDEGRAEVRRSRRRLGDPTPSLLVAATIVVALTVGLASPASAATRFVATTGNDSGNACLSSGAPCRTITRALNQAVANDTISVAAGTYNTALGESFPLTINANLTLTGAGAAGTILDATGANQRVITTAGTVGITGVTITGGSVSCTNTGSGFCNALAGGIANTGTLTLENLALSGNAASCTNTGSGSCFAGPGGLNNGGTIALTNVTLSGNAASCTNTMGGPCLVQGGGLRNFGTATLTNVTLSGNSATCTGSCAARGGGIFNAGPATLTNVTLSGNAASCSSCGGGFFNAQTTPAGNTIAVLRNTLVVNSPSGGDCAGTEASPFATFTSLGHNLSSDGTCSFTGPGDLNNTDPKLGPLQDNGGSTLTHALLPGSPAIDAGDNTGCPATDQRGMPRPQGPACDIGAFEVGDVVAAVVLNGSTFHPGQAITYQSSLFPGFTHAQVDLYLGALLPDLVTFLSLVQVSPGVITIALGPAPVPFLTNVTLAPLAVPFVYTFTGVEPVGTYFTYAAIAVAGSNPFLPANQLSLAVQAFQFTP